MAIKTTISKASPVTDMYASLETETKSVGAGNVETKTVVLTNQPKVLNIIRWLSKTNRNDAGAESVDSVNAYLTEKINQGYKLFNTHYLGENPEGFGVLYVLAQVE